MRTRIITTVLVAGVAGLALGIVAAGSGAGEPPAPDEADRIALQSVGADPVAGSDGPRAQRHEARGERREARRARREEVLDGVAQRLGVEAETLREALLAERGEQVDAAEARGAISERQADRRRQRLEEAAGG